MRIQDLATYPIVGGRTLKASSWRAMMNGDNSERLIYHYSTLMAVVKDNTLTQVSEGWGSMSDKHGMGKLRKGALAAGINLAE